MEEDEGGASLDVLHGGYATVEFGGAHDDDEGKKSFKKKKTGGFQSFGEFLQC
jgi:hypothetical protein